MKITFTIIQWLLILLLVFVVRLLTLSVADISYEMDYPDPRTYITRPPVAEDI